MGEIGFPSKKTPVIKKPWQFYYHSLKSKLVFKNIVENIKVLVIVFLVLISGGIIFLLNLSDETIKQRVNQDFYSYLLASLERIQKFAQTPETMETPLEKASQTKETFLSLNPEPYLTINAETDINAPLNVKEQITASSLALLKDELRATLTLADLTSERTYTFPNLSGVVCLTTGNCIGLGGEVFSLGGSPNRLAKFIASDEIGNSSIEDLYPGVALTIDPNGRVGIGIRNPRYSLQVAGRIQASGDICTNLAGGRCLSTIPLGGAPPSVAPTAGVEGSGTANYLPIWTDEATLGNSIIYQTGGRIGIGTTTASAALTLAGNAVFSATILPQLYLQYDTDNYLKFSIDTEKALMEASKKLVFNSLTNQIQFWGTTIQKGDYILRTSVPIFKFPVPSQTKSTEFVTVTKEEISTSTLDSAIPDSFEGSQRKFVFLINFADNIPANASSTWLIDLLDGTDIEFGFQGQALSDISEGVPHLSSFFSPPESNWSLKVKVPSASTLRIFNIYLLVFDQIN